VARPLPATAPAAARVALLAALTLVVWSAGAAAKPSSPPLRVLFVGNSLTETNDLPAVVARIARSHGRRLEYRTVAFGGYALEDHWAQGDARAALANGNWDVIVMQQGPSALPESQSNLRAWAIRWADEAARVRHSRRAAHRLAGVVPARRARGRDRLLPACGRRFRSDAPSGRRRVAAGLALRAAAAALRPGRLPPPSALGTQTAALVVYGRLLKAPLVEPRASRRIRLLEKAAARSLGRRVVRPCGA